VGGNGGIKVRATDLLCKVDSEAQAMEYCAVFMQIYREEGGCLVRTAPWIERVGLSYVKEQVVDNAKRRKELYTRFLESQKFSQIDPWAERVEQGVDRHEFIPIHKIEHAAETV